MPTSVVRPGNRTSPGLWTLVGAVVACVVICNTVVFAAKVAAVIVLACGVGVIGSYIVCEASTSMVSKGCPFIEAPFARKKRKCH